ncbi:sirohydrochlorin cobaltochelatase [Clostridium sp.]|uniref:sirohydrochlorin cobaltochelatase n=1 Tax=Clostridium sp. TaxID=1506 RepID=UPI002A9101F1|nr:sirohydrochlorin cobaltochelatase [Clostridium sp.]MDY6011555.1 sirohydrochlorin cobaltochelatase [Clostridium sp.]
MRKAILVVSFGTSYLDALENSIEKIEKEIQENFKEYDIFRSFTSHMIIRKLKSVYNMEVDTPEIVLEKIKDLGYDEVLVQPIHIIPGEEYDYVKGNVERFEKYFNSIKFGRPLFFYQGEEDMPNDYGIFIDSIKELLECKEDEAVVLFGHGSAHYSNAAYGALQTMLYDEGFERAFVGTVEGYPTLNSVLKRLNKNNIKKVKLVPLMVVAGDHVRNDMASDEDDSWKTILKENGFEVETHIHGLGEIKAFRKIYIDHIEDMINDTYLGVGKTKKLGK